MTFVFQIKKWNKPHLASVNQVSGFKVNPRMSLSLEVIAIGPSSLVELSMNLLELSMSLVELSMSLLVHTQNQL